MSHITIDPVCRRRMQPGLFARNGQIVSAKYQSDIAALVNQIARYRSKEYFRSGGDVTAPPSNKIWRFAGHIGPMARTMVARVLMAPPSNQTAVTKNPKITLNVYNSSGTLLATGYAHFGFSYGKSASEVPDEWGCATIGINVLAYQDSAFRAEIRADDEVRPISCTVYETSALPDTDSSGSSGLAYVPQGYSVGQAITDQDRQDIYDLAHALYKRGGPSLFNFSSNTDATAPTSALTAYSNMLDLGFTGDAPGFTINQTYCNRKTISTVPVKFECYAGATGTGGTVRVRDVAGSAYATFTIPPGAGWQTAITANLPADKRMYYLEHKADVASTITTYALSCFRYQS